MFKCSRNACKRCLGWPDGAWAAACTGTRGAAVGCRQSLQLQQEQLRCRSGMHAAEAFSGTLPHAGGLSSADMARERERRDWEAGAHEEMAAAEQREQEREWRRQVGLCFHCSTAPVLSTHNPGWGPR